MTRVRHFIGLLLVLLVVSAACGEQQPSEPVREQSLHPGDDYSVPTVPEPADAVKFAKAPCSVLTAEQAEEIGVPYSEGHPEGHECTWSESSDDKFHEIFVLISLEQSLADKYEEYRRIGERSGYDATWEPVTIGRHPAAVSVNGVRQRVASCTVHIAISDRQLLSVGGPSFIKPVEERPSAARDVPGCDRALEASEFAVRTIRGRVD